MRELDLMLSELQKEKLKLIQRIESNPKDVYVYTNTRYGFKEYKGVIRCLHGYDRLIIDILPKIKDRYDKWFATTPEEGTVKGSTIWFYDENREGAIKAFRERDLLLADDYIEKSKCTTRRVGKHNRNDEEVETLINEEVEHDTQ